MQNFSEQKMNFIMENIGSILLALGGLVVLANMGGSGSGQTEEQLVDLFWQQNSVNPNSHNYEDI
jgi:hypothetical protein